MAIEDLIYFGQPLSLDPKVKIHSHIDLIEYQEWLLRILAEEQSDFLVEFSHVMKETVIDDPKVFDKVNTGNKSRF